MDNFELFRKSAEIFANQGAPPVSTTPVVNLPPVSTTLAAFLPLLVLLIPVANLPVERFFPFSTSVSDTGHPELLISPGIFEKIRNGLIVYSGKQIFMERKPEVENLVALTLKGCDAYKGTKLETIRRNGCGGGEGGVKKRR
jgi:hypothetical protein